MMPTPVQRRRLASLLFATLTGTTPHARAEAKDSSGSATSSRNDSPCPSCPSRPEALACPLTLETGLRDVSTGLVPAITWSRFKTEAADLVAAREAGQIDSVIVWTFDNADHLTQLLYYSVDGIMTNEPGDLYTICQSTLD